jgi:hypothetical protein
LWSPGNEHRLSHLILAGTGVVGFSIVLLWLALEALIPAHPVATVRHFDAGHVEGVSRFDGRTEPGEMIVGGIAGFLRDLGDRPAIVVLHGVGASRADGEMIVGGCLLTPGPSIDAAPVPIRIEPIIQLLRGRRATTLLVLDCEVDAGDRDVGFVGNDFIGQLRQLLSGDGHEQGNVAVLAACAEAQMTWSIEGRHRTAFDQFVREFLDGPPGSSGRFDARRLHEYVRPRVAEWVAQHRSGAVQTPILLGNGRLQFHARDRLYPGREDRVAARADSGGQVPGAEPGCTPEQELLAEWNQRHHMDGSRPHPRRDAPIAWRRYQDALLRAERRLRAGDELSARAILIEAKDHRKEVARAQGPGLPAPWSLALLEKAAGGPHRSTAAEVYRRELDRWLSADPEDTLDAGGHAARPSHDRAARGAPPKEPPGHPAQSKPFEPAPRTRSSPRAALALDGESSRPRAKYVEGELPVWYDAFHRRGGESHELRPERLRLIRRAAAIRAEAEEIAAMDPRAVAWGRQLIEEGDTFRREAQDGLFGGERKDLKRCGEWMDRAESSYDRAREVIAACARAFDLLREVQDALPYYGEWDARSARERSKNEGPLKVVAEQAGKLAELTYQDPDLAVVQDGRRQDLIRTGAELEKSFKELRFDFDSQVSRAKAGTSWRDIDAVLRVPLIDPHDRALLCERARGLSPIESPSDTTPSPATPVGLDQEFPARAHRLARLEFELLRVAGQDASLLDRRLQLVEPLLTSEPMAATAQFEVMSQEIHNIREVIARASPSRQGGAAAHHEGLPALMKVDRAARVMPGKIVTGIDRDSYPADDLDQREAQRFVLWSAERLLDDFNVAEANRLLDFLSASRTDESARLRDRAGEQRHARIEVAVESKPVGEARGRVSFASRGAGWPKGRAVVFLAQAGATGVASSTSWSGLVDVPSPQPKALAFRPRSEGAETGSTLFAFFRGRFDGDLPISPPYQEPVKVEIRQIERGERNWRLGLRSPKSIRYVIEDQFLQNQHRGVFHIGRNLKYALEVTNQSDQPIDAAVTVGRADTPETRETLHLEPGRPKTIEGEVIGTSFKEGTPETLTIKVHEDGERRRPLCKPLKVALQPSDPGPYVRAIVRMNDPYLYVCILRDWDDPVPFPVDATFSLEYPDNFLADWRPPREIPRGGYYRVRYKMIHPVDSVRWHLQVNGAIVKPVRQRAEDEPRGFPRRQADAGIRAPEPPR